MNIKVKIKLSNKALPIPKYQTSGSAGMDLVADIEKPVLIKPGETVLISTGISIQPQSDDFVAYVFARSGLASKHGITMANCVGVIDSDYRGVIKCPVINLGKEDYVIEPYQRIAQLVFMPVCKADLEVTENIDDSDRGTGGFGSTGEY